ncbi:OmpA family protein [Bosea sp. RCC_152_1]|uniref:OmpA family protein n=1 Tax=Bosea sp. RCC_152_1 TaxID=3239228 RepID=UPI003524C27F
MSQPTRWLWGVIPLALLWGAGNLLLDDAIQRDVANRAERAVEASAGATPGARPVTAQVEGRDVTIGGEVMSSDGAAKAMAQLRGEFGVRRALGGLSQVVAQKPYSWFVSRLPNVVTIGGFVPDLAVADANVAAAGAALPGLRIDDRQTVAFGAPQGFAAMSAAMIAALPRLATGRIALDDGRFCIEGKAATPEAFLALEAIGTKPPVAGFSAVSCGLEPPTISPYRWSAAHATPDAVEIQGFVPDEATRRQILAAFQTAFPSPVAIRDGMLPGVGAPSAFLAKVRRAASELARLRSGKAEIDGDAYKLSGLGPSDYAACQALRLQIAQLDGPDSVAQATIECPPAPPEPVMPPLPEIPGPVLHDVIPAPGPDRGTRGQSSPSGAPPAASAAAPQAPAPPAKPVPVAPWTARLSGERLTLSGAVPDAGAKASLLAQAGRLFGGATVEDRMELAAGGSSAADFAASAGYALEALSKLKAGSVSIRDNALSIAGEAADAAGWQGLQALLAGARPAGLVLPSAMATVTVRPYGLSLSADRGGAAFSGYLPDEATRAALHALVAETPLAGKLEDTTVILPGAPDGFAQAAKAVLADLLRLDIGSATLTDRTVMLRGLTCRDLIRSEVETSAATGLPPGFSADVVVSQRQTGCVVDPPASCQNDLDGLTRQNPVLFAQGTAVVDLDPVTERVIGEAASILKKCPGARVTIEGHANRDGEWRGFDNLDLSMRRAERVRDELARRGIDPAQLVVKGYGSTRPLLPYGAAQAREMNRRVQFTVAK